MLLDEPLPRTGFAPEPLTVGHWLADPVSAPFRHLWLTGDGPAASLVMLENPSDTRALAMLEEASGGLPGVTWVDRTADISRLLGHYRSVAGWLLPAACVAIFIVLLPRYGRNAVRALLPATAAGVGVLAILGWAGQPVQLFHVLALLLLLGIGLDYGIFLLEHRGSHAAWVAISSGAASTCLAFGLLSLSSTPALRDFGVTMLTGIALVWLIAPLLRLPACGPSSPAPLHESSHALRTD